MRTQLLHAIAWISARHVRHFESCKTLSANIGAWFMRRADQKTFEYYEASMLQRNELQEIKALSAAMEIKDLAMNDGGWDDHHGIGLEMVAGVLVDQHGWFPEDVDEFIEELSEGFFKFGSVDDEDVSDQ